MAHAVLVDKLECYGVRGTALQMFNSFLENRTQFMEISHDSGDGMVSYYKTSISGFRFGAPQASIMGPLLFFYKQKLSVV